MPKQRKLDRSKYSAEVLVVIDALATIADYVTSEEADDKASEDATGLTREEIIEAAHDDMIGLARRAMNKLIFLSTHTKKAS